jgi:hypothetical protein
MKIGFSSARSAVCEGRPGGRVSSRRQSTRTSPRSAEKTETESEHPLSVYSLQKQNVYRSAITRRHRHPLGQKLNKTATETLMQLQQSSGVNSGFEVCSTNRLGMKSCSVLQQNAAQTNDRALVALIKLVFIHAYCLEYPCLYGLRNIVIELPERQ